MDQTKQELERACYVASFLAPQAPFKALSVIANIVVIVLGWWSVPLECFIRREFGERYLSWLRLWLGYMMIKTFTFGYVLIGALSGGISTMAFFGYSGGLQSIFMNGTHSLLYHLFFYGFIASAILHRYRIWERNQQGRWHSLSFGVSRLAGLPLQDWVDRIPRLSKWVRVDDWFLYTVLEPGLCFALALFLRQFDGLLGTWLLVASIALGLKNALVYFEQRGKLLDLVDAQIESTHLSIALQGADKAQTEGFSVMPVPATGMFSADTLDIAATVADTLR